MAFLHHRPCRCHPDRIGALLINHAEYLNAKVELRIANGQGGQRNQEYQWHFYLEGLRLAPSYRAVVGERDHFELAVRSISTASRSRALKPVLLDECSKGLCCLCIGIDQCFNGHGEELPKVNRADDISVTTRQDL